MAEETMKDFLISLGWKVEESGQRKFIDAIEAATLRAKLLGDALVEAAKSITEKVTGIADDFEQLYYAAQRTGAAVTHIRAFEFAFSQTGSSAEAARNSLETFGRFMRNTSYASENYLASKLGIQTKINGIARDNVDVLFDASERLRKLYSDPKTKQSALDIWKTIGDGQDASFQAFIKTDELRKNYDKDIKSQKASGIDDKNTAADAKEFVESWSWAKRQLENMLEGAESKLFKALAKPMEDFGDYLEKHSGPISTALQTIVDAIAKVAERWLNDLEGKIDWNGFAADIISVSTAVTGFVRSLSGLVANLIKLDEASKQWLVVRLLNKFTGGDPGPGRDPVRDLLVPKPEPSDAPAGSSPALVDLNDKGDVSRSERLYNWVKGLFGSGDKAGSSNLKANGSDVSVANALPITIVGVPGADGGGGGSGGTAGGGGDGGAAGAASGGPSGPGGGGMTGAGDLGSLPPTPENLATIARLKQINPSLTTGQCVELVQKMMGVGNVHDWRPGATAKDAPPGAAMATFGVHGEASQYAYGGSGTPGIGRDHAVKLLRTEIRNGILTGLVLNQWKGSAPHLNWIPQTGKGGEGDLGSYRVIMGANGAGAGDNEALLAAQRARKAAGPLVAPASPLTAQRFKSAAGYAPSGQTAAAGSPAVQNSSTWNIALHGHDPMGAPATVGLNPDRTSADLAANLQGATQ